MNDKLFYREFELDRSQVTNDRTIDISFSSEMTVERWFGKEILLHGKDNIDFSRIKKTGALLMNHDPNRIIGSLSNIRLENNNGRAKITFDDDEDGNKALSKIRSGSLKGVSFGYMINKFRKVEIGEEWEGYKGPAYIATRWSPYEITLTPIPADHTIGVGRSLDGIEIESNLKESNKEERAMDEKQVKEIVLEATKGLKDEVLNGVRSLIKEEKEPKMLVSAAKAKELTTRAATVSQEAENMVSRMIFNGKTETEVTNYIFDELAKSKRAATDTGNNGDDGTGSTQGANNTLAKINDEDLINGIRTLTL
jgi:HK97 family phage prohead protease